MLESLKADHDLVVTLEDGVLDGGFGEKIARFYGTDEMKVLNFGLKKKFYDRYDYAKLCVDYMELCLIYRHGTLITLLFLCQ